MEPNRITQNTCMPKIKSQTCCPQTDDQILEEIPQPTASKLFAERENVSSPYYHREIF
ncbi:MAG: hypothetical protein P8Y72_16675 [Anaerolineales bacterium]